MTKRLQDIKIRLPEVMVESVHELSKLTGQSVSSIIRGLVSDHIPGMVIAMKRGQIGATSGPDRAHSGPAFGRDMGGRDHSDETGAGPDRAHFGPTSGPEWPRSDETGAGLERGQIGATSGPDRAHSGPAFGGDIGGAFSSLVTKEKTTQENGGVGGAKKTKPKSELSKSAQDRFDRVHEFTISGLEAFWPFKRASRSKSAGYWGTKAEPCDDAFVAFVIGKIEASARQRQAATMAGEFVSTPCNDATWFSQKRWETDIPPIVARPSVLDEDEWQYPVGSPDYIRIRQAKLSRQPASL